MNQKQEPILKPIKFWKLPPLKVPDFIETETLLKTKTLICKTQNANLKRNLFLKNRPKDLMQVLANGLRYLRVGGRGFCLGAGKTRSEKNA
ncbi:MAG: hypothetical protein L6Q29_05010 [Candidatus Pacebacteria bacterium]|nr:hypothetical protein [Candidatus Paceibacterota bacterium]